MNNQHRFFISNGDCKLSENKTVFYLALFTFFAFFFLLGARPFYGSDEIRVAAISLSFDVNDNWFIGAVNGRMFVHKPPLYFWLNGLIFRFFDADFYTSRIVSAFSASLNVIFSYLLARKMKFSRESALLSSVILISCAQFFMTGRSIIIDVFLSMTIGLCWLSFYALETHLAAKDKGYLKISIWSFLLIIGFAAGIMSKGLVGLIVPLSGIGIWMLWDLFFATKKIRWSLWIILTICVLLSFIPTAWWCVLLYQTYGYKSFKEVVIDNNFGRFLGPLMKYTPDHKEAFYYYLAVLHELFTPWIFFVPFMIFYYYKQLRKKVDKRLIYLILIFIVPFILFNISSGKRRLYLLPLYMPLAIMFGEFIFQMFKDSEKLSKQRFFLQKFFFYFVSVLPFILPIAYTVLLIIVLVKNVVETYEIVCVCVASLVLCLYTIYIFFKKNFFIYLLLIAANTVLILIWSNDLIRTSYQNKKESYIPLEKKLEEIERNGHEIILINARERLASAVVFFRHHNVIEGGLNNESGRVVRHIFNPTLGKKLHINDLDECYFLIVENDAFAKKYNLIEADRMRIGSSRLVFYCLNPAIKDKSKAKIIMELGL
ncbi:phospholipid carrier-dependent glycosyltransferase [Lentisphaerota bacterium WC36G]|nr:phospholipid carrier-dependent glycosyltransferase [Lentisphaerae bacterium WC36]